MGPFEKLRVGQALGGIPSNGWNKFVDTAKIVDAMKHRFSRPEPRSIPGSTVIAVINEQGPDLEPGDPIVPFAPWWSSVSGPDRTEDMIYGPIVMRGANSVGSTSGSNFAIALETIKSGEVGYCVTNGLAWARVRQGYANGNQTQSLHKRVLFIQDFNNTGLNCLATSHIGQGALLYSEFAFSEDPPVFEKLALIEVSQTDPYRNSVFIARLEEDMPANFNYTRPGHYTSFIPDTGETYEASITPQSGMPVGGGPIKVSNWLCIGLPTLPWGSDLRRASSSGSPGSPYSTQNHKTTCWSDVGRLNTSAPGQLTYDWYFPDGGDFLVTAGSQIAVMPYGIDYEKREIVFGAIGCDLNYYGESRSCLMRLNFPTAMIHPPNVADSVNLESLADAGVDNGIGGRWITDANP